MRKLFLCFCVFAFMSRDLMAATDIRIQMLDAQIENLEHERETKLAELQQCEKQTKGFKIAGLSTLALTGVGIYANVKLHEELKKASSGSAGGGNRKGNITDKRSEEQKISDECKMFCKEIPEDAVVMGCRC